ncbi:Ribosomal RNA small subunit methyltransferase I, partial [human gut metagenome]
SFTFAGFLPKRGKHRVEELQRLSQVTSTLLFYEAPHRLQEVLEDMYEAFGNRSITVARELTKKFETFVRT